MTSTKVPLDIRIGRLSKAEQAELVRLYARRSAIDALMESLVIYDRSSSETRTFERRLKTA